MSTVVYLDWNVIVHMADGVLPAECLELVHELTASKRAVFPYTWVHIDEAARTFDLAVERERKKLLERLIYIREISGGLIMEMEGDQVVFGLQEPTHRFQQLAEASEFDPDVEEAFLPTKNAMIDLYHALLEKMEMETKEKYAFDFSWAHGELEDLRSAPFVEVALGCSMLVEEVILRLSRSGMAFDPRVVGSATHATLPKIAEAEARKHGADMSFQDLMKYVEQNSEVQGGGMRLAGMSGMLQAMGFRRDNASTSRRSRLSDAMHLEFGKAADLFISHDRKLFGRAELVYKYHDVQTQVVWAKQMPEVLRDILNG